MQAASTEQTIASSRRDGAIRSLSSLAIKVGAAGLTYLTYVVLSRLLGESAYGQFALGLSIATMLAILAGVGQQTTILKVWPAATAAGRPGEALASLRAGGTITALAGLVLAGVLAIVAVGAGALAGDLSGVTYLLAAAVLIVPMAMAEYQSAALRAQGSVWIALAPRDIAWRLALCLAASAIVARGHGLSGTMTLLLAALLLAAVLGAQRALTGVRYRLDYRAADIGQHWRVHGASSRWFLLAAILESVSVNMDTVIVGLMVDEQSAGLYFNAFRTAGLLTLFLFANALVVAPALSRHHQLGERRELQRVLAASAWSGFAFSLAVFAIFVVFGRGVLTLFGPGYAEGYAILIILGIGLLFDSATGPARTMMMMTGHERGFVLLFGAATIVGLVVAVAAIPAYGLIGAATANTVSRAVSRTAIAWWCVRQTSVDPTIFGALRLFRADRPTGGATGV